MGVGLGVGWTHPSSMVKGDTGSNTSRMTASPELLRTTALELFTPGGSRVTLRVPHVSGSKRVGQSHWMGLFVEAGSRASPPASNQYQEYPSGVSAESANRRTTP